MYDACENVDTYRYMYTAGLWEMQVASTGQHVRLTQDLHVSVGWHITMLVSGSFYMRICKPVFVEVATCVSLVSSTYLL